MSPIHNEQIPIECSEDSKGWYSRNYLPHFDEPGLYQAITFRLHDSVPDQVVERWKQELRRDGHREDEQRAAAALRRRIIKYEDAGNGACWLANDRVATLVQAALLHFDGQRYNLIAWCIMPNHVHVLIETQPGHALYDVLHSWKSFTALRANQILGRSGPFWSREYYDRYIRDVAHLQRTVIYIEQNPVEAGLVKSATEWRYSSAAGRSN